eukprot:4183452-Amphidinium_carterae.1
MLGYYQCNRQEQKAAMSIRKCIQKLKTASPETYDEAKQEWPQSVNQSDSCASSSVLLGETVGWLESLVSQCYKLWVE